jgi:hypothetical protein
LDEIKKYLDIKDSLGRVEGWTRKLPDGKHELVGILSIPTENNVVLLFKEFYPDKEMKISLAEEDALKLGRFLGAVLSEEGFSVSKTVWRYYKRGSKYYQRFMKFIDRIALDIYGIQKLG